MCQLQVRSVDLFWFEPSWPGWWSDGVPSLLSLARFVQVEQAEVRWTVKEYVLVALVANNLQLTLTSSAVPCRRCEL